MKWYDLSKEGFELTAYKHKDGYFLFVLTKNNKVAPSPKTINELEKNGFASFSNGYATIMSPEKANVIAKLPNAVQIDVNPGSVTQPKENKNANVSTNDSRSPTGKQTGTTKETTGEKQSTKLSGNESTTDSTGDKRGAQSNVEGQSSAGEREVSGNNTAHELDQQYDETFSLEEASEVDNRRNINHFYITDEIIRNKNKGYSPKERYEENIEAIKILKELDEIGREASDEEKSSLAKYNSWGSLSDLFNFYRPRFYNSKWKQEAVVELKDILSEAEINSAASNTPTSYYTSPEIIKNIWDGLYRAGFKGGNVLEPSLGSGSFFGLMHPNVVQNSNLVGVEIENLAGRIAQKIYPDAKIIIDGFEKANLPDKYFDVVTSNVPFGDYSVYDPQYKKHNYRIHDYYILKSLDKAKPNGLVAVITSSYTMDKQNSNVRKRIAENADLLTAIRLPSDSQQKQAGVNVTEDILFFKKKETPKFILENDYPDWVHTSELDLYDENVKEDFPIYVNNYFLNNPKNVLGESYTDFQGGFGRRVVVKNNTDKSTDILLNEKIKEVFPNEVNFEEEDLPSINLDDSSTFMDEEYSDNFKRLYVGSYFIEKENNEKVIYQKTSENNFSKVEINGKKHERLLGLIELRDALNDTLETQKVSQEDTTEYLDARGNLNSLYDDFIKSNGYINKPVNANLVQDDPAFGRLMALEKYDKQKNIAEKSDIFTERVIQKPKKVTQVDNVYEALLVSLNQEGYVDLNTISNLCGKDYDSVKKELVDKQEIFLNPQTLSWESKSQYLSGNIRKKLKKAQTFTEYDKSYQVNVDALEKVKPEDLQPKDIDVKLGAPWIDASIVQEFADEVLDVPKMFSGEEIRVKQYNTDGSWYVKAEKHLRNRIASKNDWGTHRVPFPDLLEIALNQRQPRVTDTEEDENGNKIQVFNFKETIAAEEKLDAIQHRFRRFIWEDDVERAEQLLQTYNDTFNTYVPPKFSGKHMSFPGMSINFRPRTSQSDAVWRCLHGNTLLGHEVGTGKTFIQIASAMEMKRLGIANKPIMAVRNATLEQINREAREIYPNANILMVTNDDLKKENRKKFIGKVANNNWDLIVITHSMFGKIQNNPEFETDIIQKQINNYEEELINIDESHKFSIKKTKRKLQTLRSKLERISDKKQDDGVYFDDLGLDALIVDESHNFKNLTVHAASQEISSSINGSQRAWDLYMKTEYLNKMRSDNKGIIFASGTPITNSPLEIYNMQRYLQPELLKEANIELASNWAATFLNQKVSWEPDVLGSDWKKKSRFTMHNVPELMQQFRNSLDVVKAKDIGIKLPEVEKINIVSPISDLQEQLMKGLSKDLDNGEHIFSIMNKGKHISLDPQTINEEYDDTDNEDSKVNKVSETVYDEWKNSHDIKGAQLVFCDLSTPKKNNQYSVYDSIKEKLIENGIPESDIAFIHDYNSDAKRANLFSKIREGEKRVLIGSTEKMGEGLNVQDRLVALHHIDAPWTPAKVEQRNGRIIRFGNENEDVKIFIYTTQNTFDLFKWNLLKIKEAEFSKVLQADKNIRTFNMEVDPTYSEVSANASNNPYIKEKLETDHEILKLESLSKSHSDTVYNLKVRLNFREKERDNLEKQITLFENIPDAVESPEIWRLETTKYGFEEDIETNREKFLPLLKKIIDSQQLTKVSDIQCGGLPITFSRAFNAEHGKFETSWYIHSEHGDLYRSGAKRVEDFLSNKEEIINNTKLKLKNAQNEIQEIYDKVSIPFEYEQKLNELYAKQRELNEKIGQKNKENKDAEEENDNLDDNKDNETHKTSLEPEFA